MTIRRGESGDFRAVYAHARRVAGYAADTLGLFWAVGPDAVSYLQGIVSQDIEGLAPGQAARSFLLEPRGKLDALLWVLRDEGRVGIITAAARQAAVIASTWMGRPYRRRPAWFRRRSRSRRVASSGRSWWLASTAGAGSTAIYGG